MITLAKLRQLQTVTAANIFIGRIILEKIDFEKRHPPKKKKVKGVNLNFLTILDHFWDLLKRLKKASLDHWKRF